MKISRTLFVSMLLCLVVTGTAVAQTQQTLTILGAYGTQGEQDPYTEYYNPSTQTWQRAYLSGWHPWGFVPGTNSWLNYKSDPNTDPACNTYQPSLTCWYLYRVRFSAPSDWTTPKLSFQLKADNFAWVDLNGTPLNTTVIEGEASVNADFAFEQALQPGLNTITIRVGDYGGLNGFNYRIDMSVVSTGSLGVVNVSGADTTPPVISSLTASPSTLWPPNHQMVSVTLTPNATDNVGITSLKILSVTSNEPDNGLGDGDTPNDIQITGNLTLNLRAERSGNRNGRVYTITVEAKDAAGNAATKTVTVSVPKSQGGK